MAESTCADLVLHWFPARVDIDKLEQSARITRDLLDHRIGEVEPVLQKVNAQNLLDADDTSTSPFGLRLEGLDFLEKFLQRIDHFHFVQKRLSTSLFMSLLNVIVENCELAHRKSPARMEITIL